MHIVLAALLLAAADGFRWEISPSSAACLGVDARVGDLYVLEIPRAANVTVAATAGRELMLIADDETPRTIVEGTDEISALLVPGRYYVGVADGVAPYALTLSAPELFGNAAIDVTEKAAACDTRPTITAGNPAARPPATLETGINANTPSKRHRPAAPPKPCTFTAPTTSQSVTSNAGTGTFNVTSSRDNCGWGARTTTSWLTVTGATGAGNGTVSYSFAANTSTFSRSGTITAAGRTVTISQLGACSYTLSPTSRDHTSSGGTGTISLTTRSDCAWTSSVATAASSWLTITAGGSGTGNGTITYSVAPNTSTSSRSGSLTIGGRTFTVNQGPDISSCTYSLAYTSKTMTWCGGERTLQVTTQGDCPWMVSSNQPWLVPIGTSRSGTRAQSYTVSQNTTGAPRQATLTAAGQAVTITQNARAGGGQYDGTWAGTTNTNRAVSMCVADNAIQDITISVRLEFPTFACITPITRQQELAITGNTFSGQFITYPEVANIFTTVRGTFTSASAVNGSWDPYSGSYFIICGSTIGIGTGGNILSAGTFTATKQP
jgi:Putative binding domain, N-terminal/Viral BACON domain